MHTAPHHPRMTNSAPAAPDRRSVPPVLRPLDSVGSAGRYGITLGVTALAVALTLLLRPITAYSPFLVALPVVLWCAWYGGMGPGIASTFLAALSIGILVPALAGSSRVPLYVGALQALFFGGAAAVLAEQMVSARAERDRAWQDRVSIERLERERDAALLHERNMETEVSAAQERMAFLTEVGDLLTTSLDPRTTLERMARLAVAHLADWCAIDMVDARGRIRRLAAVHADASRQPLADALMRYPPRVTGEHSVAKAINFGKPIVMSPITQAEMEREAQSEQHRESLCAIGFASVMVLPLTARGKTLGAITLGRAPGHPEFTEADLVPALDLSRRAALGADNAQLYQEAQTEIAERTRAEKELERHQAQIEALNERLQRAMTETHHRVKNNLQIIAAMVDMRVLDETETVPTSELERIGGHIRTLAAVHDILTHQSKDEGRADDISAKEVLDKLVPMLQAAAGLRPIVATIDDTRLTTRQCTSLAVVANELVSNAIKYGQGDVELIFRVGTSEAVLEVLDDGPGFPAQFDPDQAANTGLELVQHLSQWDLGGWADFGNRQDGGARVAIHIPLHTPTADLRPARADSAPAAIA